MGNEERLFHCENNWALKEGLKEIMESLSLEVLKTLAGQNAEQHPLNAVLILFWAGCWIEELFRFLPAGTTCRSIVYGIYVQIFVYGAETTIALLVNKQYRGNPKAFHMALRDVFRQKNTWLTLKNSQITCISSHKKWSLCRGVYAFLFFFHLFLSVLSF